MIRFLCETMNLLTGCMHDMDLFSRLKCTSSGRGRRIFRDTANGSWGASTEAWAACKRSWPMLTRYVLLLSATVPELAEVRKCVQCVARGQFVHLYALPPHNHTCTCTYHSTRIRLLIFVYLSFLHILLHAFILTLLLIIIYVYTCILIYLYTCILIYLYSYILIYPDAFTYQCANAPGCIRCKAPTPAEPGHRYIAPLRVPAPKPFRDHGSPSSLLER